VGHGDQPPVAVSGGILIPNRGCLFIGGSRYERCEGDNADDRFNCNQKESDSLRDTSLKHQEGISTFSKGAKEKLLGISRDGAESLRRSPQQDAIELSLILIGNRRNLVRYLNTTRKYWVSKSSDPGAIEPGTAVTSGPRT
jgi:hypothetical protein